jgi:hypothetical protein
MPDDVLSGWAGQSPVPKGYFNHNERFQEIMLMIVEHCHQSDYQATLDSSLRTWSDTLRGVGASAERAEPYEKILSLLLQRCYDVDMEKTLVNIRETFGQMNVIALLRLGVSER